LLFELSYLTVQTDGTEQKGVPVWQLALIGWFLAPDDLGASHATAASTTPVVSCLGCPPVVRISEPGNPLIDGMLVGQAELTWREYLVSVDEAGCPAPRNRSGRAIDIRSTAVRDDYPMTSIKPDEIDCYLTWLQSKSGKPYRLPTEAEWQAVASIGVRTNITLGEVPQGSAYLLNRVRAENVDQDARDIVRWRGIVPVRRYDPSAAGLYDVFGNASEATTDRTPLLRSGGGAPYSLITTKGGTVISPAAFRPILDRPRVASSVLSDSVGFRLVCKEC
jgi:formylglycine-generating enzyme required for sulfatase activity